MKEHAIEAAKLSPAGGVLGLNLFGVPLQEWTYILTIIYMVVLITDKVFPSILKRFRNWFGGLFR